MELQDLKWEKSIIGSSIEKYKRSTHNFTNWRWNQSENRKKSKILVLFIDYIAIFNTYLRVFYFILLRTLLKDI